MSRRNLSIIFIPHDRGHSRTLRTSYRQLKVLGIALGIGLIAIAGMVGHYGILLKKTRELEALKAENQALRGEVSRVDELSRRLEGYEAYVSKINAILGVTVDAGRGAVASDSTSGARGSGPIRLSAADRLAGRSSEGEVPSEWPLTCRGFITRGYSGEGAHPGVDIAVPLNTPVRATASGRVLDLGWDDIYGNYVEIQHGGPFVTLYGHNASITVRVDQWVRKGDIIAYSGDTGRSSGPHLHYEVRCKGVSVDPQPYLVEYQGEARARG